jgi:spectinomycin phosphotransferase
MLEPPVDLDAAVLRDALREHWAVDVEALQYAPVGFGSHHWHAQDARQVRWFVTVDDLDAKSWLGEHRDEVMVGLSRAYATAASLREDCGLGFVLSPVAGTGGAVARRLTDRWAVSVVPHVDGQAGGFADRFPVERHDELAGMLAALHASSPAVRPRTDDPAASEREDVLQLLDAVGEPWDGGPWSAHARAWCVEHRDAIGRLLDRHEALLEHVTDATQVVTHGEPHSGNVLVSEGRCLLIDWDTVATAPPERDLWLAAGGWSGPYDETLLASYQRISGRDLDRELFDLYRVDWLLSDVASLAGRLRDPHGRTPEVDAVWGFLTGLRLDID